MAPAKKASSTVDDASSALASSTGGVGSDDPTGSRASRIQDAPRDTPGWVKEAMAWIAKERETHQRKAEQAMKQASSWAGYGYIDIASAELRKASYENGMEYAFMLAHMRLLEGQQGLR